MLCTSGGTIGQPLACDAPEGFVGAGFIVSAKSNAVRIESIFATHRLRFVETKQAKKAGLIARAASAKTVP